MLRTKATYEMIAVKFVTLNWQEDSFIADWEAASKECLDLFCAQSEKPRHPFRPSGQSWLYEKHELG